MKNQVLFQATGIVLPPNPTWLDALVVAVFVEGSTFTITFRFSYENLSPTSICYFLPSLLGR